MKITIYRCTSNHLYTMGKLMLDDRLFCHTLEHTFSMLPAGKYTLDYHWKKDADRCLQLLSQQPLPEALNGPHWIAPGNTWKDALTENLIVVGKMNMPGMFIHSQEFYTRLARRLNDRQPETVTVEINDRQCQETQPLSFWTRDEEPTPTSARQERRKFLTCLPQNSKHQIHHDHQKKT